MDAKRQTGTTRRTMITVLASIVTLMVALMVMMTIMISDQFDDDPPVTAQEAAETSVTRVASDDRPTPAARPPVVDATRTASDAVPRTPPASWISPDDYPASALRADEQGRSVALIDIAASGYPRACAIVVSSGSAALDQATCRVAMRRARFLPPRNAAGEAVEAQWHFPVRWVLPQ